MFQDNLTSFVSVVMLVGIAVCAVLLPIVAMKRKELREHNKHKLNHV